MATDFDLDAVLNRAHKAALDGLRATTDVEARLAEVMAAVEDDEEIGIRSCDCWGEGCRWCNGDGVIYP